MAQNASRMYFDKNLIKAAKYFLCELHWIKFGWTDFAALIKHAFPLDRLKYFSKGTTTPCPLPLAATESTA